MQINIIINIGILAHIYLISCGGRGKKEINTVVTLTDPIWELLYRDKGQQTAHS